MKFHFKKYGQVGDPADSDLVWMVAMDEVDEVAGRVCAHGTTWETYYHAMMAVCSWRMLCVLIGRQNVNACHGRIFWDAVDRAGETGDWTFVEMLATRPEVCTDTLAPHSLSYAVLSGNEMVVRSVLYHTREGLQDARKIADCNSLHHLLPLLEE